MPLLARCRHSKKWLTASDAIALDIRGWTAYFVTVMDHNLLSMLAITDTQHGNPLKPGIKSIMKMRLEQHTQAMLQLHLTRAYITGLTVNYIMHSTDRVMTLWLFCYFYYCGNWRRCDEYLLCAIFYLIHCRHKSVTASQINCKSTFLFSSFFRLTTKKTEVLYQWHFVTP